MIGGVVGEMHHYLRAGHHAFAAAHEREMHLAIELDFRQPIAPGDVPVIQRALLAPQLVQRRMVRRVARREAVLASLEMRLEDKVDHVDVVQRVDDVLEDAAPRLRRLAFGQRRDRIVDLIVGPRHVARECANVAESRHGIQPAVPR